MGTKIAGKTGKVARNELQYMTKGTAGVAKNGTRKRFVPDANASGAHTVFRRNRGTGKITHYETFSTLQIREIQIRGKV